MAGYIALVNSEINQMKISRFFPWLKEFFGNNGVEVMVVTVIICLLAAIAIPNFQAARRQSIINASQRTTQTFEVGDSVYIDTLNIKGRINEVHRFSNPEYDILIVGSNGEPTLIKNIKGKLLKKI
jgi:competence protein ComGC